MRDNRLTRYLNNARPSLFNLYCIIAAFSTYFCMYAFRKPFTVGRFEGSVEFLGLPPLDYKIILILAQVIGYTLSKFLGIKVVSELHRGKRGGAIIGLILLAWLALLLFAVIPSPFNLLFLFLNGVPLGMVWGLVFGFLEGRRSTELLGAGLSVSYIVASGAVKSVGQWILQLGVSEFWMPFITGSLFLPPIFFFVYLLKNIPPPTREDEAERVARKPMDQKDRKKFFLQFAPGLIVLTGLYMFLTAYRDFRDNFAREIWDAVGFANISSIFTLSEIPIALIVLLVLALMMLIKNNRQAVALIHWIMFLGSLLIGLSTYAFEAGYLSPLLWMIAAGLGLYLVYVPYGCIFFDRLIAYLGVVGTAGFMIYVTEAFGYLGSVVLLFYKNLWKPDLSWLRFFIEFSYICSAVCAVSLLFSHFYFQKKKSVEAEEILIPFPERVPV